MCDSGTIDNGGGGTQLMSLIDIIQKEEDLSRVELVHIQQGRNIGNPNPVYQRVNERIETVVGAYGNRAPMDYLRGIAHSITV